MNPRLSLNVSGFILKSDSADNFKKVRETHVEKKSVASLEPLTAAIIIKMSSILSLRCVEHRIAILVAVQRI